MKFSAAKVDSKAMLEGQWQKDLPELADVEVLVRGLNHPGFRRQRQAMINALAPNKKVNGQVDPIEMDRINGICMLNHIVLDWKNFVDDQSGAPLPYSRGAAEIMMTDPDFMKYRDAFFVAASRVGELEEEADKALVKN